MLKLLSGSVSAGGVAVSSVFDTDRAFGGDSTVANLERAYQALDRLESVEIRLFQARESAIQQQLQVDIEAERDALAGPGQGD